MGNEEKRILDNLKAGLSKAQSEASQVAKKVAKATIDGADAVKTGAGKAKDAVKTGAGKAKDAVDAKARAALDKAYAAKKPLAVKHLKKLRTASADASPQKILDTLSANLHTIEKEKGAESSDVIDAVALYVLTCVEVYGSKTKDPAAKQRLIDATIIFSSETTKNVAEYGGLAIELVAGRFGAVGKVVKKASDAGKKLSKFAPLAKLVGVENLGRQSVTKIAEAAVLKSLGTPPTKWPVAASSAAKAPKK
jgi:ElaB/YqjD/DUF883 family membrane-anchored ribosome-binding protein